MKIKTGDKVLVIKGRERGKSGVITAVDKITNRIKIEGLNIIKRHMKQRGPGKPSGIIEREAPIQASNVMLICPNCGRASRTGNRFIEETDHKGRQRKVRFCKACDAVVDK